MAQVHELIGKAMAEIGAIGKNSKNSQQGFMYRGIDAVYNALNPVMAKYGLFICPEVLEQNREERVTKNGTALTYTVLTIKYTMYAPDGSNVSLTVIGEVMDSGDKSANKAMSIAMKYAMFQLFFIPTEELKDPDADVYENVKPKTAQPPVKPVTTKGTVTIAKRLPDVKKTEEAKPTPNPVMQYLIDHLRAMREMRQISAAENNKLFKQQFTALVEAKLAPDKKLEEYTMEEAEGLITAMYTNFPPTGDEQEK